MKRVLIACFLLLSIIAGCIGSFFSIQQRTDSSNQKVRSAIEAAVRNDISQALAELQSGQTQWTDDCIFLSALVDHQTLDEIDTLYRRAICFASTREVPHLLSELEELSAALERIQNAERLSLETLL